MEDMQEGCWDGRIPTPEILIGQHCLITFKYFNQFSLV